MNERIGKWVAWLGLAAVVVCTGNAVARYALNIGSNAWLRIAVVLQRGGVPPDRSVRAEAQSWVFLLLGYPVAFSLAANGLLFGLIGIAHGNIEPALLQALPERVLGIMADSTLRERGCENADA